MAVVKPLTGIMELELTSAELHRSIQDLLDHGVEVYETTFPNELVARFSIRSIDYPEVRKYCDRKGIKITTVKKKGIIWAIKNLWNRKFLICGIVIISALAILLHGRIFFFEVQGNDLLADALILESASDCGIRFGISGREVRSEKMKNALLAALPELQWAGINTYGNRGVITVRERKQEGSYEGTSGVSSIVADRDGVILSCTVTGGSAAVVPGQAVRAGQVLISGYTDLGISIGATRAEGEVYAITSRDLAVEFPQNHLLRQSSGAVRTKYSLLIGKNRINFYKGSGISDAGCVKMYSKYVLTLPGGFVLPVALIRESLAESELSVSDCDPEEAHLLLSAFASRYLRSLMIAGIVTNGCEIFFDEGVFRLQGRYECQEMIGRVKPEQIGVYDGKTD